MRRSLGSRLGVAIALAVALLAPGALRAQGAGFQVIVNAANPVSSLTRDEVARLFLRKTRVWPAGSGSVEPVDQRDDAVARRSFSTKVLGKDITTVRGYWQQQVFTGKGVPPLVKPTDADVIAFVAATPGAVGYVAAAAELPPAVKTLRIVE